MNTLFNTFENRLSLRTKDNHCFTFLVSPYCDSGGGVGAPEYPDPDVDLIELDESLGMVAPPPSWGCGCTIPTWGLGSVPYCCPRLPVPPPIG